jgi:hypothetical protein
MGEIRLHRRRRGGGSLPVGVRGNPGRRSFVNDRDFAPAWFLVIGSRVRVEWPLGHRRFAWKLWRGEAGLRLRWMR